MVQRKFAIGIDPLSTVEKLRKFSSVGRVWMPRQEIRLSADAGSEGMELEVERIPLEELCTREGPSPIPNGRGKGACPCFGA